ncbi:MAG: ABC transporter permease [Candidatus Aminicenantes bacterium]|nr:MAG: ABC transporter permease [Candidatus Aminicenantes bacterium]
MFKNHLKIALRSIGKNKAYSFINISGLAIGMACCILILLWIQDELSFDRFHHNVDRLGRVVAEVGHSGQRPWAVTEAPLSQALKEEFPEIVQATRAQLGRQFRVRYGEKRFNERNNIFAEPAFFEMFTFPFIRGNPKTALSGKRSVVITENMAQKYFGAEDPLGKMLNFNDRIDFQVTGVLQNIPKNSHLQFDFALPFHMLEDLGQDIHNWGNFNFFSYVLLDKTTSVESASRKISGYMRTIQPENDTQLFIQPLGRIHLHSDFEYDVLAVNNSDHKYIYIFASIALFVLFIACINFINLTTARSRNRAKEVAMRKVVGANRKNIIKQFYGESLVFSFVAFGCALALVFLFLPFFNNLSEKRLTLDVSGDILIPAWLLGIAFFTGFLSGSYPSLYLSSFQPGKVLKRAFTADPKRSVFRKVLVVVQFSLSIFLIIGTTVVDNQIDYIRNRKLGFEKENLIYMPLVGGIRQQYETVKNEWLKNSNIVSVTASSNLPSFGRNWATDNLDWEGKNPEERILMQGVDVDYDFFETFGMQMTEGRGFSREFVADENSSVILNKTAINTMGLSSPVGKRLSIGNWQGTIIGVVQDYNFKSLHNKIEPLILVMINRQLNYMFVRIKSQNLSDTIKFLKSQWEHHNPQFTFEYGFVDTLLGNLYANEEKVRTLFNYFTFLAIFISCLGLFGLAFYLTEQRTKEIGVRKVLGASVPKIVTMLSKEFLKWVLFANIIAWPVAYYFMDKWLQNFAYRTGLKIGTFLLSGALAFMIALLTVSYQTIKAANANPVDSLRYE